MNAFLKCGDIVQEVVFSPLMSRTVRVAQRGRLEFLHRDLGRNDHRTRVRLRVVRQHECRRWGNEYEEMEGHKLAIQAVMREFSVVVQGAAVCSQDSTESKRGTKRKVRWRNTWCGTSQESKKDNPETDFGMMNAVRFGKT